MVPGSGTAGSFCKGAPKMCSTFAMLMPRTGRFGPDISPAVVAAVVPVGASVLLAASAALEAFIGMLVAAGADAVCAVGAGMAAVAAGAAALSAAAADTWLVAVTAGDALAEDCGAVATS